MCINFLQITQKVLTKEMVHFLELTTEILSFLQTFSVRKTTSQLFLYLESLTQNINEKKNFISGIFWIFQSKLKIIHTATYLHCFFMFLVTVFDMFCAVDCYLSLLFSHFMLLFSPSFWFSSRHEIHSAIYNVWFSWKSTLIITNPML